MLRTYRFESRNTIGYELEVRECKEPDTVILFLNEQSIALDRETFQELATLASYGYGDHIHFARAEEEVQD